MIGPLLLALLAPGMLEVTPTDDLWVYPHAGDPLKDAYLRSWGSGGLSVAANSQDLPNFSYSYLRFDLSKLPPSAKITEAKLILTHVADPAYPLDEVKTNPLEVRPLQGGSFREKEWNYDLAGKLSPIPGKEALLGSGFPTALAMDGKPFTLEIDLLKGPYGFRKAIQGETLSLALTSAIDAEAVGMKGIFKVFSKDAERPDYRPKLRLAWTSE